MSTIILPMPPVCPPKDYLHVKCVNCGATSSKAKGNWSKVCEYCGSELIRRPTPPECVIVRE